jgi:hypothetical protein
VAVLLLKSTKNYSEIMQNTKSSQTFFWLAESQRLVIQTACIFTSHYCLPLENEQGDFVLEEEGGCSKCSNCKGNEEDDQHHPGSFQLQPS